MGSYVSLAQVQLLYELRVVDCSIEPLKPLPYSFSGSPVRREQELWRRLNEAFSEPVRPQDNKADYAPTQVLAEAFKDAGYDGILYSSRLGKGKSVAIFELDRAYVTECLLRQVEAVTYSFAPRTDLTFS